MFQYRFLYLLSTLTLLMLVSPFVGFFRTGEARLGPVVISILFSAVVLAAVIAVSKHRMAVIVAGSLAAPTILLQGLNLWLDRDVLQVAESLLATAFLAYTVILLLDFLFTTERVTFDTISASLCGYLLLGVLWSIVFSLLEIMEPGSFASPSSDQGGTALIRFGADQSATALYFSYVTMTTLGYGDIVPATMPARMFCAVEAIMGQIYLTVLVARLVALHIVHERSNPS